MSSYNATPDTPSKARAIAGVIAVHVALGAVILTGLNVDTVRKAVERMQTIAVFEPEPPEPPPPPEQNRPETARKDAGAPARKAEPTPVVAPEQRIPAPSPIPAAKVAGQGSAMPAGPTPRSSMVFQAQATSFVSAGRTMSSPSLASRRPTRPLSPFRRPSSGNLRPEA